MWWYHKVGSICCQLDNCNIPKTMLTSKKQKFTAVLNKTYLSTAPWKQWKGLVNLTKSWKLDTNQSSFKTLSKDQCLTLKTPKGQYFFLFYQILIAAPVLHEKRWNCLEIIQVLIFLPSTICLLYMHYMVIEPRRTTSAELTSSKGWPR